jgi:hypothetical protein
VLQRMRNCSGMDIAHFLRLFIIHTRISLIWEIFIIGAGCRSVKQVVSHSVHSLSGLTYACDGVGPNESGANFYEMCNERQVSQG